MTTTAHGTFEVTSWDEQEFDQGDDTAKLTEAIVAKTYSGDIEGTSTTRWLMAYAEDGTAAFVGVERLHGSVAGQTGTLVLQHLGRFEDGAARATLSVLSGTGDLGGAAGDGDFLADPAGSVDLRLTLG
jgi:hypothetical protein